MVAHQVAVHVGLRRRLYEEMEPSARARPRLVEGKYFHRPAGPGVIRPFRARNRARPAATPYREWIGILNLAVLIAFALEYLTRLWVVGEDSRYRGPLGRARYVL